MTPDIIPVILCGGTGARLWPASTPDRPKQLLPLAGARTMLQDTARRALNLCGGRPERLITVTNAGLAAEAAAQLAAVDPGCATHILAEPSARNTGAAVALATLYAATMHDKDALLLILPSDHTIGDEAALAAAIETGLAPARDGTVVAFGIAPSRPDTGYGYINKGKSFAGHNGLFQIAQFVEKPDVATAFAFVESGAYLWNSGIFLCSIAGLLQQFRLHAPDILAATDAAARAGLPVAPDPALYAAIPALPFDKAIMERLEDGAVAPCDPQWADIGSWDRLWEARGKDGAGNACRGEVVTADTKDCLIESLGGRLVACAGLRNIVVVDTGDTVLVADRGNADAIRVLAESLQKRKS
jgi:mannose-1-phosphate guanylyltransferase/mannose-6-phosphate isomerase